LPWGLRITFEVFVHPVRRPGPRALLAACANVPPRWTRTKTRAATAARGGTAAKGDREKRKGKDHASRAPRG